MKKVHHIAAINILLQFSLQRFLTFWQSLKSIYTISYFVINLLTFLAMLGCVHNLLCRWPHRFYQMNIPWQLFPYFKNVWVAFGLFVFLSCDEHFSCINLIPNSFLSAVSDPWGPGPKGPAPTISLW